MDYWTDSFDKLYSRNELIRSILEDMKINDTSIDVDGLSFNINKLGKFIRGEDGQINKDFIRSYGEHILKLYSDKELQDIGDEHKLLFKLTNTLIRDLQDLIGVDEELLDEIYIGDEMKNDFREMIFERITQEDFEKSMDGVLARTSENLGDVLR